MNLERLNTLFAAADIGVLLLLGLLSIWTLAIVIERLLAFRTLEGLASRDDGLLADLNRKICELEQRRPGEFERNFEAAWYPVARNISRGIPVLGTLGNSAPFIGLFGTVLGVIKAFQDLSLAEQAGPQVVMAGISQALIATAMGLLVAIPAAVMYNYFSLRQRRLHDQLVVRLWEHPDGLGSAEQ